MILYIVLALLGLIVVFVIVTYNGLVTLKKRVEESWSGIDIQLKRRANLIPNLVETVKGYASHEKDVFENVSRARAAVLSSTGPEQAAAANNMLTSALKSVFAVAEAYPELKASANFGQLQGDLADTEDKLAYSRQFYNANALEFNTKVAVFPTVLLASMFNFKPVEFFKASDEDRQDVKVKF